MPDYTTTALKTKAKLWGAVPTGQPAFTDANILDIMSDELITTIVPFITQFRSEYFVTSSDFSITSSTTEFDIPSRAVGGVLRDVKLVQGSGTNEIESDVPLINTQYTQNHNYGFYLEGNKLKLIKPENFTNFTLRLYYYFRPSVLVETSDCALVTSVTTTTFDVSSIPSSWTSGETTDIIQSTPPFNTLASDITSTWSGTTVTPSTMPDDLAAGDYLCLDGETPIPPIPVETFPMLVQATVVKFQEILTDKDGLKMATEKYEKIKESVTSLLAPRVVGEIKKVNNYDNFLDGTTTRIYNLWD